MTGDRGAEVVSRQVPELNAVTRRLDFVLTLKRGSEVYLRHLEFEMKNRKGLALRVFEYAAALAAEHGLPVASTVMILKGPAPSSLRPRGTHRWAGGVPAADSRGAAVADGSGGGDEARAGGRGARGAHGPAEPAGARGGGAAHQGGVVAEAVSGPVDGIADAFRGALHCP